MEDHIEVRPEKSLLLGRQTDMKITLLSYTHKVMVTYTLIYSDTNSPVQRVLLTKFTQNFKDKLLHKCMVWVVCGKMWQWLTASWEEDSPLSQ